jgi:hypothetical protein
MPAKVLNIQAKNLEDANKEAGLYAKHFANLSLAPVCPQAGAATFIGRDLLSVTLHFTAPICPTSVR